MDVSDELYERRSNFPQDTVQELMRRRDAAKLSQPETELINRVIETLKVGPFRLVTYTRRNTYKADGFLMCTLAWFQWMRSNPFSGSLFSQARNRPGCCALVTYFILFGYVLDMLWFMLVIMLIPFLLMFGVLFDVFALAITCGCICADRRPVEASITLSIALWVQRDLLCTPCYEARELSMTVGGMSLQKLPHRQYQYGFKSCCCDPAEDLDLELGSRRQSQMCCGLRFEIVRVDAIIPTTIGSLFSCASLPVESLFEGLNSETYQYGAYGRGGMTTDKRLEQGLMSGQV